MKTLTKKIIEIRSKERWLSNDTYRWVLKLDDSGTFWTHLNLYTDEETTVCFVKENKRGFTFSFYFAGKYIDHFISRGDCEIIYEL